MQLQKLFSILTSKDIEASMKDMAQTIKNMLKTSKVVFPISIEAEGDDAMVIFNKDLKKYVVLDYIEDRGYLVKVVLMTPYAEFMRKMKAGSEIICKGEYDYCLQSSNKTKVFWYKKEDEEIC